MSMNKLYSFAIWFIWFSNYVNETIDRIFQRLPLFIMKQTLSRRSLTYFLRNMTFLISQRLKS